LICGYFYFYCPYRENEIDLIEIYPADLSGNWKNIIDEGIYETLERRIKDYISKTRISHDIFYLNTLF